MGGRAFVLDDPGQLPHFTDKTSSETAAPGVVAQGHVDDEVDVVGDLPHRFPDAEDPAQRDASRQAVDGGGGGM